MSIKIGDHVFDGPFTITKDLLNDPGVFAVIVAKDKRGALIDVGESNKIRECVESHQNKIGWNKSASSGTLCFAVLYTPQSSQAERISIEQNLRTQFVRSDPGQRSSNA